MVWFFIEKKDQILIMEKNFLKSRLKYFSRVVGTHQNKVYILNLNIMLIERQIIQSLRLQFCKFTGYIYIYISVYLDAIIISLHNCL